MPRFHRFEVLKDETDTLGQVRPSQKPVFNDLNNMHGSNFSALRLFWEQPAFPSLNFR